MTLSRAFASVALAGLLAAPLAASAQPPSAAYRGTRTQLSPCIDSTFIRNWVPYDNHTVLLDAGARSYRVTTSRCTALTSPLPQIRAVFKGGSSICSPHDVDLYVGGAGLHNSIPCFVQSIQQISPDEERAMLRAKGHR